jgi:hypothetical protein
VSSRYVVRTMTITGVPGFSCSAVVSDGRGIRARNRSMTVVGRLPMAVKRSISPAPCADLPRVVR